MAKIDCLNRMVGGILGYAIGDAIGAPAEFNERCSKIEDYTASPRKGLEVGQFTDDTQHLMISLESLICNNGDINLYDHADRLVKWYTSGEARSIGHTTELAVKNLLSGIDYNKSGINNIQNCGSLALPRLIPVSLLSSVNGCKYKIQRREIRNILSITHSHKKVIHMGNLINYFVQEIMHGKSVRETIDMIIFENSFLTKKIRDKLSKIEELSDSDKEPKEAIRTIGISGFVEDIVYSAIYSALKGNNFRDTVLISANGIGDADSRTALAGMFYGLQIGERRIPEDLKDRLEKMPELKIMAKSLYSLRK